MANIKPTPPHGTFSRYTNQACRCDECKAAARAYSKAYREANRDKAREYEAQTRERRAAWRRARYAANPQAVLAKNNEWQRNNPWSARNRTARWQAANPERAREVQRRWRESHPLEELQRRRNWTAANRELTVQYSARRRALKLAADVRRVSVRDWDRLKIAHRNHCAYCGSSAPLTQDHIIPLVRGGRHAIGNLLPACQPCNSSKGSKLLIEWLARSIL